MKNASRSTSDRQALIFGLGFSGRPISRALRNHGWEVVGTSRDGRDGTHAFDGDADAELVAAARTSALIISTIPPRSDGSDPVLDAISAFPAARAVIYLSATSVYGDRKGGWAYEDEAPRPLTRRGFARAEAELRWLETGAPVHILRCGGIYGPGRSAFDKMDRAVVKDGHVVNRIHVDDIAGLALRIATCPAPGIYNVTDGHPAPPQDVVDFAASLSGRSPPQRIGWQDTSLSDMARSFYAETKRIDTGKAQRTFGWTPTYSDYRKGLRAILDVERGEDRSVD